MSLREQVVKGGAYLAVREGLGLAVSLGGVLLLTRLIGPANYGLYAGSLGIVLTAGFVGRMGLDVCLVRRAEAPPLATFHQAFTFLLLSGLVLAAGGVLTMPLLGGRAIDARFVVPLQVLLATLPVTLAAAPAVARLERDLNYRAIAWIDLSGQIVYYLVALPLAAGGAGVWAPVAGYWSWQVLALARAYAASGYRPRLAWSTADLRDLLGYGLGYSSSTWVWQLRSLVNPLVVGRFLGPEAVGYVSLAVRFSEVAATLRTVAWRLSIATLAKIQTDRERLRRAMEEAMVVGVLAVGPLLAGIALVGSEMVPPVFGARWEPALAVYPFIALGVLVNSAHSMQSSVLYVLRQNGSVTVFHLTHVALFAAGAALLVPRVGLIGYGLGEVLALGGYLVLHRRVARLFTFSYADVAPWLIAFAPALFAGWLPLEARPLLWLPVGIVALFPRQRRQIRQYFGYVVRWRPA